MASKPQPLAAGEVAPDFTATASDGRTITLSELRGQKVALYFYPKDATPGCTKQACNLQANDELLASNDIVVIGVSPDDDESHQKFAASHDLAFPLLADPDHEIIEAYGVWGEKSNYGKTYLGLQRTTFLIDAEGTIQHVFKRPRVADHAAEIISKL